MNDVAMSLYRKAGVVTPCPMGRILYSLKDACRVLLVRKLRTLGFKQQVCFEILADAADVDWDNVPNGHVKIYSGDEFSVSLYLRGIRDGVRARVHNLFGGVYTQKEMDKLGITPPECPEIEAAEAALAAGTRLRTEVDQAFEEASEAAAEDWGPWEEDDDEVEP